MVQKPSKPPLMYKDLEQLKVISDNSEILKSNNSIERLKETAKKLYKRGVDFFEEEDEEKAYISLMRFLAIITFLQKQPDFKNHENYYKAMFGSDAKKSLNLLLELEDNLRRRYSEQQSNQNDVLTIREKELHSNGDCIDSTIPNDPSAAYLNNEQRYEEPIERISLTSKELFNLAQKGPYSVLVIDVRPKDRFMLSHMKLPAVINVPENIIPVCKVANKLEKELDKEFQTIFKERKEYNQIVLVDEDSTEEKFTYQNPLFLLNNILTKWDPGKNSYRNKHLILNGGYDDWLHCYPTYTTDHSYRPIVKQVKQHHKLDDIDYSLNLYQQPPPKENNLQITTNDIDLLTNQRPTFDRSKKPNFEKNIKSKEGIAQQDEESVEINGKEEYEEEKEENEEETTVSSMNVDAGNEHTIEISNYYKGRRSAVTPVTFDKSFQNDTCMPPSINRDDKKTINKRDLSSDRDQIKSARDNSADSSSGVMKRCLSTPNISEIITAETPAVDRSIKPRMSDHYESIPFKYEEGGLTGLKNLGNTCYMNSVIQCLSNTYYLREHLLSLPLTCNPNSKTCGKIAEEMRNIIRLLWADDDSWISPKNLKYLVGYYRDTFSGYEQQDSHEFLTILIDWLHEDLNKPDDPVVLYGADEKTGEKSWGEFIRKNNSIIRQLFYGQQKSTVMCRLCGEKSITFEPFSNISLPLPNTIDNCTLRECLQLYLKGESISGWLCPKCKETKEATKKLDITRLPPVLVIHFKRFTSDGLCRKKQTLVEFPIDTLDMSPFVQNSEHRNRSYELYAVSNHYGSMESGHYTAYCKNSNRWYKYDDQEVNQISKRDIVSSAAYIVFYNCVL